MADLETARHHRWVNFLIDPRVNFVIAGWVNFVIVRWVNFLTFSRLTWGNYLTVDILQGWVTYRTRNERKLALASAIHTYERPGRYRVLVKVVDIFGNDTSRAFDTEVK